MSLININNLNTEFGAWYKADGHGVQNLSNQVYFSGNDTISVMTEIDTEDTVYDDATVDGESYTQPWRTDFAPTGTTEFKPKRTPLNRLVLHEQCVPDELEGTWAGFLTAAKLNILQYPFVAWWLQQKILPSMAHNFELYEIYNGVFDGTPPVVGVPKAKGKSINGIKKTINDDINGGRIVPIILGTPPTDPVDFVNYMEAMVFDNIPEEMWKLPMNANMNSKLRKRFMDGMRKKYNTYYPDKTSLVEIDDTNIVVNGLPSMKASNKIWITPKTNIKFVRKRGILAKQVQFDVKDFVVARAFTNWSAAVHISDPRKFFTNDVELPV